jgi:fido (protein-threonine AMPylation protein)
MQNSTNHVSSLANDIGSVPENLLGITGLFQFKAALTALASFRVAQGIPSGNFDSEHAIAIHKHIFQDILPNAGELRVSHASSIDKVQGLVPPENFTNALKSFDQEAGRMILGAIDPSSVEGARRLASKILCDISRIAPFEFGNEIVARVMVSALQQANPGVDVSWKNISRAQWDAHVASSPNMQGVSNEISPLIISKSEGFKSLRNLPSNEVDSAEKVIQTMSATPSLIKTLESLKSSYSSLGAPHVDAIKLTGKSQGLSNE